MLAFKTHRELRVDLQTVDDATARRLLREHRRAVMSTVAKYAPVAAGAFHALTADDLQAIAEAAVLEAWLSYERGDVSKEQTPGSRFRFYVGRVVGWRVSDAVNQVRSAEPDAGARYGGEPGPTREAAPPVESVPAKLNGHEARNALYSKQLHEALREGIARLPLRERIIVSAALKGETQAETAQQLGLSPGRISQCFRSACDKLREHLASRGFDSASLGS